MPNNLYPDLPLTNFPGELDSFITFLDMVASDGPLIHQYMQAVESGNQAVANDILATIPQATQKIIKAVDLNKLSQAVQALERFYKSDIQPYVDKKQVLTIRFCIEKDGVLKTESTQVKMARGAMVNWIITQRISSAEELIAFHADGYVFHEELSSAAELVFVKRK